MASAVVEASWEEKERGVLAEEVKKLEGCYMKGPGRVREIDAVEGMEFEEAKVVEKKKK